MSRNALLLACSCLLLVAPAVAHGGGLNAAGCHNVRKTGGYHCHRSSSTPRAPTTTLRQASPPVSGLDGRNNFTPNSQGNTNDQQTAVTPSIEDDRVFGAQVILKKNGCYSGILDGVLGPDTIYAIKLFEANVGITVTGKLGATTYTAIQRKAQWTTICR